MRAILKYRAKKVLMPSLLLLLMAYFIYHLVQGHYGLLSWQKLRFKNATLLKETEKIEKKAQILQDKVNRLQPNQLDLDYVEELVHEKVGVYHLNDLIVHNKSK